MKQKNSVVIMNVNLGWNFIGMMSKLDLNAKSNNSQKAWRSHNLTVNIFLT